MLFEASRLVSIRPSSVNAQNPFQRFIYRDQLNPVAWQRTARNLVTCPGGVDTAHFVYGADPHTPDMMIYDDCSSASPGLPPAASDVYRLLRDERGSVRLVIRVTNGEVIQRVDYDAWGAPTRVLPSSALSTMVVQPFGFAGGIWMPEAQLWHFGARDLDPTTGRWTTKDPILFNGGYNLYMYCTNDPVNRVDPEGLLGTDEGFDRYARGMLPRPSDHENAGGFEVNGGITAGEMSIRGGVNVEYTSTEGWHVYGVFPRGGVGLDVGASACFNLARGEAGSTWSGDFESANVSEGAVSAGAFWTPDGSGGPSGGFRGVSLGGGVSPFPMGFSNRRDQYVEWW